MPLSVRKPGACAFGLVLLFCAFGVLCTGGSVHAQVDADPRRLLEFRPRTPQEATDPQALRRLFASEARDPAHTDAPRAGRGGQTAESPGVQWLEYGPPSRERHAMVYDSRRDRMLVMGGDIHHPAFNVWAIDAGDASRWEPITASGGDDFTHRLTTAVYDSLNDRVIMAARRNLFWGAGEAFELWALELGGAPTWHPLAPGGPPVAWGNINACLALDPDGGRLFLSGGRRTGDVWMLDFASATWLAVDTTTNTGDDGSNAHFLAYDRRRHQLIVSRGDDAWALRPGSPAVWTPLSEPSEHQSNVEFVASDVADDRLVLVTGNLFVRDMPAAGGSSTHRGDIPATRSPGMSGAAFAFDPTRGALWTHGGYTFNSFECHSNGFRMKTVPSESTWMWDGLDPTSGGTRLWHTLLIDEVQRRAVVVGGINRGNSPPPIVLHAFDDRNAGAVVPSGIAGPVPPAGLGHAAVLDPVGRQVLFIRAYDTALLSMSLDAPFGCGVITPGGTAPDVRRFAHFVYEPARDRFLFFGGDDRTSYPPGIWELVLRPSPAWRQLACTWSDLPEPPVSAFMDDGGGFILLRFFENTFGKFVLGADSVRFESIPGESPLSFNAGPLGYDPVRNTLLLAERDDSGRLQMDRLWRVSVGETIEWEPLPSIGPHPYYRLLHGSAYSSVRDGIVLFGGWEDFDHDLDDWWVLEMHEPVPTLAALIHADAGSDAVSIEWSLGGGDAARIDVERREPDTDWQTRTEATATANHRVQFEDHALRPATRYGYRLRVTHGAASEFIGETWLTTSAAPHLALLSASRATGRERWDVSFSLARAGHAELELFDVSGRCLARERLGSRAAGIQRASFEAPRATASGVYFVRLRADDGADVRRVAATR